MRIILYILRRLVIAIPTLLGIVTLVFIIMRIARGDPAATMLWDYATPQAVADLRHQLGLDQPLPVQYITMITSYGRGDLGRSFTTGQPALGEILRMFPYTFQLAVVSLAISIAVGIPAGILSAYKRNTLIDYGGMTFALVGICMPSFWLGILLILVFSVWLDWLPAFGAGSPDDPASLLSHLVLPALTLGWGFAGITARMTRSSMLEILNEDYIRVARAKGLRERNVFLRHAFKNALITIVTILGLNFGRLLGGTVVIEVVFARPGTGKLLVDSILMRDYPQVQATVVFFGALFLAVNLLVDITYAYIDPRIRVA